TAITENLLDGLGVLIPVSEIFDAIERKRFLDYKPKHGEDTVLEYRPGLAEKIALLPEVDSQTFSRGIVEARAAHQRARANPGIWEKGNMPLGADEREYVPSDDELLAAELGHRISIFTSNRSNWEILKVWDGAEIYQPTVEYDRFTFRHVDVMGSGRFFYASAPERIVIDFGAG
ncbi:MAG: hypothetical protein N2C12_17620, partial [Planctomycetales bacterium]